jgi:hypothetical protein
MHNPTLIPALLRDTSVNNGLVYRELRKALPCRIGIEFEMGKLFLEGFRQKYDEKATDESMAKHYGVFEIRSDNITSRNSPRPRRRQRVIRAQTSDMDDRLINEGDSDWDLGEDIPDEPDDRIIETRVSITNFRQLAGLYRFMQDLPEFCLMHEGGGIHIHIDMSMYKLSEKKAKEVVSYIKNRLDIVGKLFPTYKGKYNKRAVGYHQKSTWVNVSAKNTLEFRTPPLTFDYYTLMKWITGVVKFRNILIHECKLVLSSNTTDKIVKEVLGELQRLSTPDGENYTIYTNDGSASSIQLSSGHTWVANNYTTSDPWTSG